MTIRVAKKFTDEGIPLGTADTHDDVGIEMAAGQVRTDSTMNNRIVCKGGPRANGIYGFEQINPLATKLAMTGVQPTQSYGHHAMGMPKTLLDKLRTNAAATTAICKFGRCSRRRGGEH